MTKSLLIIIVYFTVLSCDSIDQNAEQNINLIDIVNSKQKMIIEIADSINFRCQHIYVSVSNDGDSTIVFRTSSNSLMLYDWNKKKIDYNIEIPSNGTKGKGTVNALYYNNKDSIFIAKGYTSALYISDYKINTIDKIDLSTLTNNQNIDGYNQNILNYKNNTIYFAVSPFHDKNIKWAKKTIFYEYNIDKKQGKYINQKYPIIYQSNLPFYYSIISSTINKSNELIMLYSAVDSLYVKMNASIKAFKINSQYMKPFPKYGGDRNDFDREMKYWLENGRYDRVIYNSFRDETYVIAYHGISHINDMDNNKNKIENQPFSIIIFDKYFKQVGETFFESDRYLMDNLGANCFVTNEGLWISTNNQARDDFDENIMRFELFEFVSLNENQK